MKVLYDECIEALRDNKCSECNDFYQCSVCDYFQEQYEKGKADAQNELPTGLYVDGFNDGYEKGRTDAIEECIEILRESYPIIDNEDILYGFSCAIYRMEQLKEQKNE